MSDRKDGDDLELDWSGRTPRGAEMPAKVPTVAVHRDPDGMPDALRYSLEPLLTSRALQIHQVKEWVEAFTGWETGNKYAVEAEDGRPLLYVNEQGAGLLATLVRNFWSFRTIRLDFATLDGTVVMRLERPWRFLFARAEISGWDGRPLGSLQQRFAIFRRRLDVLSSRGEVLAEIVGPALKPWTFEVHRGGEKVALIRKRWSGFGVEMITDADKFGIDFLAPVDPQLRQLLVASTLMIDLLYFEVNRGGSRGGMLGLLGD